MTKKTTIKYISDLMNNPARLTAGDQGSIGGLRQSFPYFVPVRYLDAVTMHRESPYSPTMLSAISPYMGNWILFSDFMEASLQVATNDITDTSNMQEPEKLPEVVEETSIPSEQETIIITHDVVEETPLFTLISPYTEEAITAVADNDTVSDDIEITETAPNAPEVTEVEIATEDDLAQIIPDTVVDEAEILNEPAIIEDILPEEIHVIEIVSDNETMIPVMVEEELVIATEPTVIENITPEENQITDNSDATEILLPTEIAEEVVTEAELNVNDITPTENSIITEQLETSNNVEVMAETNIIENITDTTTDIEEEHKNFWSQGDEEKNTTTTEDNTLSSVAAPIPDQLPIKKTPAPEPTAQSQIPDEEFRPTQHSRQEKPLIYPIYTEDYFLQQGEKISPVLPTDIDRLKTAEEVAKSLMVMMSFSEWLLHFKSSTEKQKEETKDQRALKTMWQKEKLAAAIEEENEEIPENVFEMAVNSITKEDGLASESLADIYIKQGKLDKAIDMYRKLSLRNPQKNAYFALKIEEILKEKQL
jgi:hypothetical protein